MSAVVYACVVYPTEEEKGALDPPKAHNIHLF